jgi:sulfur carrier protein
MLKLTVNGESRELSDAISVAELVERLGYDRRRVAVEVNEEVVPLPRHADHRLATGDAVEIVTLVGGGSPREMAIWTGLPAKRILFFQLRLQIEASRLSQSKESPTVAPYFLQFCPVCAGYISDALLECLPLGSGSRAAGSPEGLRLRMEQPGVALACPYCTTPIGFDPSGRLIQAPAGWPLLRYSRIVLEQKMLDDGAPQGMTLEQWALTYRFDQPGSHKPLTNYLFAEQAPSDETVP